MEDATTERNAEWVKRHRQHFRKAVVPTQHELGWPAIIFFLAAVALPLAAMVVFWVLFGLSLACLDDSTDISDGGDCVLCIDCELDGTPTKQSEAQRIGTFCRYPGSVTNATTFATSCTEGSAIIMGFAVPGVVISMIALFIVILFALFSIVGACKVAHRSAETSSQQTVTLRAVEEKRTERWCCRSRPRLPTVISRKRCCGDCRAKAAVAVAEADAEAEAAAAEAEAAAAEAAEAAEALGAEKSDVEWPKSVHTPPSLRPRRALDPAFAS